jgi:hypothetical protein
MRDKLYWITVGGLCFWLPAIAVSRVIPDVNLWALNVIPLASLGLLGVAGWKDALRPPKWGWVLAGIYVLGPACMVIPSVLLQPGAPAHPGDNLRLILICLFPPMTLWLSLLNFMIFAVLTASLVLPFLAMHGGRG